ncbi:RING-like domain-containing protein [Pleurostoma richardsiae]|uniref:Non-structural maintenance of chromosomes element 1 homolog n=1 Tax=Pleurostoma richardsiae TaxID=41990 RepID=A0AA38R5D2_9PEZI|nr:RING-like domain-containing protein [Pleurostoma richardsiae]
MEDWAPPVPDGYNDSNRAFLQAFISRGTFTFAEAAPILAAIVSAQGGGDEEIDPDSITQEDFEGYIAMAREAVSPLDYDIRSTMHQTRKVRVWALINAHSDPATQLATAHTPDEISFIKRMLDAMFETYNTPRMEVMAITAPQARNIARPPRPSLSNGEASQTSSDRGLKHGEVENLIANLVEEGWLEKSREGFYSLSPRSLMELWSWLMASYNDPDASGDDWQRIKFCEACKEIVTVGQRCSNRDCNVRLHDICQDAYWRTRREKKCPKCQNPWTGKHFVGERAVTETEAFQRGRRRGTGGRRSDLVDAIMRQNEEDGEEQPGSDEGT